jgi:hypothetical protein
MELIAAIRGGEQPVGTFGEAELSIELLGRLDVRNTERHVRETVQGHLVTPMWTVLLRI